ncbi:phage terminase small subunit P27 family [Sphingomonas endolithica]|uniref:phage terminase small subunit P27 family n=1 Tax=Sphingomonas endolithica TaxID=2972485 RepID=UPI0021AF27F2|nr:phage terminase small subunit P27 family [Sphingomonas sp. ZFBP2030]
MAGNSNSGRKRKPTQLKLVEGRTYRMQERAGEPIATGQLGAPPSHFNQRQGEIWAHSLEHAPAGLLKSIDGAILASWCVAQALHEKAVEMINLTPAVIKSPNGTPLQSPWLAILNKQAIIMRSLVSELGFSPAARARISIAEEEDDDPTAKYFN